MLKLEKIVEGAIVLLKSDRDVLIWSGMGLRDIWNMLNYVPKVIGFYFAALIDETEGITVIHSKYLKSFVLH